MEDNMDRAPPAWVFEKFVETSPDILFMFSPDWRDVLFVSDAYEDIWGESIEDLHADPRSFLDRVHPDDRDRVVAKMKTAAGGEPIENEFRVVPAAERGPAVRHVWTIAEPVFDETGELVGLAGFVRDITKRTEYKHALEQANERREVFTQFLSHDIHNQLTIADGRLRQLQQEYGDDEHVETARQALDRIRELTNDVLELIALDRGALEREMVSMADIARRCWEHEDIDDEGTLVVEDTATLSVSPGQFRVVFENLFRNAIEHTGIDPEVRVGVLSDGSGLYVADSGSGVRVDDAESVFEPGQTSGGTGLGLAFVRAVVRLHGGAISVTESRDGGARFEITNIEIES